MINIKNNKNIIITAIVVVLVGTAAFFGGIQYQKTQGVTRYAQFAQNGQRRQGQIGNYRFGRGMMGANGRAIQGQVVSADNDSITVKLPDGSSKIVNLSSTTTYNKTTAGSKSDVTTGTSIAVFGTANSDGSVTAQSVSINPQMRFGRDVAPSPKQ